MGARAFRRGRLIRIAGLVLLAQGFATRSVCQAPTRSSLVGASLQAEASTFAVATLRQPMQLANQSPRLSPSQRRAMGIGMGIGALTGLVVAFAAAPDDCGLECLARPAAHLVGGAGVGLIGGLAVAIFLEDGRGDSSAVLSGPGALQIFVKYEP